MQIDFKLPEHIENMIIIKHIINAGDDVGDKFEDGIAEADENLSVTTSRESGIRKREKILGLQPLDTDTLEDRRLRVKLKWHEKAPYTLNTFIQRLDACLGNKNYVISVDYENMHFDCLVELKRKSMVDSVVQIIEGILPINMTFAVRLRYNKYKDLKIMTYKQVSKFTYKQLREDTENLWK